jgi:hypothetical protein
VERGKHLPMTTDITALDQRNRERDLLEQWIRSANPNEIGLLDLVVLDGWIAQQSADGGPGSAE